MSTLEEISPLKIRLGCFFRCLADLNCLMAI